MKIHFLKRDALEALRTNINSNLKHYADETNDWIYNYFNETSPFLEYKNPVNDFELINHDNMELSKSDVLNAISLYSSMKDISDTQATDERLWAGLCHCDFWGFLKDRWAKENDILNCKQINTRYFFAHNRKRSLITNTLSRLWWLGRLTYDSDRKNPFELTHYFENDFSTKIHIIFSNNFMSSRNVSLGMISALKQLEQEGFKINGKEKRAVYYEATKYLNVLGGTYILDYFSQDEISQKVTNYLKKL